MCLCVCVRARVGRDARALAGVERNRAGSHWILQGRKKALKHEHLRPYTPSQSCPVAYDISRIAGPRRAPGKDRKRRHRKSPRTFHVWTVASRCLAHRSSSYTTRPSPCVGRPIGRSP